jgi:AI-2 transport protein TqsA
MNITRTAAWFFIIAVILTFLVVAQNFLIPLVVAACVWFIINSIAGIIAKIKLKGRSLPMWLCRAISMTSIVGVIMFAIEIIVGSVNGMIAAVPQYQTNLDRMMNEAMVALHIQELPTMSQIMERFDLSAMAASMGAAISGLAGSLFLVLLYVVFMLLEQNTFPRKWRLMFGSRDQRRLAADVLEDVNESVRNYITYKTGINLAASLLALLLVWAVGLDFPIFWAFLIFLINWIPTIGSLVSVTMPTLFALVQFDSWTPVLIVFLGILGVQTIMFNIVEPRVLGKLLNISGLVVILALVLWGSLWGIVGMVLSVPIMVSLIIVLSKFESTKSIAIWLSADGFLVEE